MCKYHAEKSNLFALVDKLFDYWIITKWSTFLLIAFTGWEFFLGKVWLLLKILSTQRTLLFRKNTEDLRHCKCWVFFWNIKVSKFVKFIMNYVWFCQVRILKSKSFRVIDGLWNWIQHGKDYKNSFTLIYKIDDQLKFLKTKYLLK